MKSHISNIGVLDKTGHAHQVSLSQGLNIITGRSSTGKSALLDIVDYCLGASRPTIPYGKITDTAHYYYTIFQFESSSLILGREAETGRSYILETTTRDFSSHPPELSIFKETNHITRDEYNKSIGRYFGITMDNVDEHIRESTFGKLPKSPTPSIRSYSSYIFQNQNLIANKHAIFYRFDEKSKREQAIDHLKIFLGLVDDHYFVLSKNLDTINKEIRQEEAKALKYQDLVIQTEDKLELAHSEYMALTNKPLFEVPYSEILLQAEKWLHQIRCMEPEIDSDGDSFIKQYQEFEIQRSLHVEALRKLEIKRNTIASSIKYADQWKSLSRNFAIPEYVELHDSECPFCGELNSDLTNQSNTLSDAILWLNSELRRSAYMRESDRESERQCSALIEAKRHEIRVIETRLYRLKRQIDQIGEQRSLIQATLTAKSKIEALLETLIDFQESKHTKHLAALNARAALIKKDLKKYNLESALNNASVEIDNYMNRVGKMLGFDPTYTPISLHFELDSFDLYHQTRSKENIYLNSMGSGANWLACHISLFLSLQHIFCRLQSTCKIPPILFLDQPSQVYFPATYADNDKEFDADKISTTANRYQQKDEDLRAVENLYNVLIRHCKDMEAAYSITPQVIICDHADHLTLADDEVFEHYVKARWRAEGAGLIQD